MCVTPFTEPVSYLSALSDPTCTFDPTTTVL